MTKPKAKTTNAKKTGPLPKKGKLAFVQPVEDYLIKVPTPVPKVSSLQPSTYALQKDVDAIDEALRIQLKTQAEISLNMERHTCHFLTPALEKIDLLSDQVQYLNLKVNIAIAAFSTIVVVTGIANLVYWLN